MNVFLVLSPLQLINAQEAKKFFGTKDNTLIVLRHTSQGYPLSMFKRLLDEADWDRVIYLYTYGEERVGRIDKYRWAYLSLLQQRRLERLAAELKGVDRLFVGLYSEPLVRHFSNVLPHKTLCLLDDGSDTVLVNEARKQLRPSLPSRMSLLSKLLGIREKQAAQVIFFTIYALEVQPGDTLVLNRYEHFRAQNAVVPVSDEVWFLGGPLSLDGYVGEATYLQYLKAVHRFYQVKRFIYVPHSREQEADVEQIRVSLGCEVRRPGLPVELALSRVNQRPSEIVSFITAALTNCHVMFGATLQITAVHIAFEHLLKHHVFVREIYRQFYREADDHFRVLTLEQLAAQTLEAETGGEVKSFGAVG